jgi:hypothetical protein
MKKFRRQKKEKTVRSERKLLQYRQMPDKISRDTSKDISNFLQYFKMFIYFVHISGGKPNDVQKPR